MMMDELYRGRIIKALAGFYYVKRDTDGVVYACRAKGIFKKRGMSPLVGDKADFVITHEGDKEGNISAICERKSVLNRPTVANVDVALVVFALKDPDVNLHLLDRMLVVMEDAGLDIVICFNKTDIADHRFARQIADLYSGIGYDVVLSSTGEGQGIDELKHLLKGHRTTVAGPSGAGKSSIINALCGKRSMEVGTVSEKIGRGKQTTRHVELLEIERHSYIVDTPGFSSLELSNIKKEELAEGFPEMREHIGGCKYRGCSHISEPEEDCRIRLALRSGGISNERYESYCMFYDELKELERRKYQ